MARQIGMFKISFVMRTRREQDNARMLASWWRQVKKHFALPLKKSGQSLHLAMTNLVRENSRKDGAVLPRITCAARRLSPICQYPPPTIRGPPEVARKQMHVHV